MGRRWGANIKENQSAHILILDILDSSRDLIITVNSTLVTRSTMFYLLVLVTFVSFATLASFHPTVERNDAAGPPPRALYFITEQQTTGQVAALPIDQNGRVSAGSLTPLGSGPPANQSELNFLTSQYSIIVVGNVSHSIPMRVDCVAHNMAAVPVLR